MTGESFYEYIGNVFIPFLKENQKPLPVILFLDGHKSHLTLNLSKLCCDNKIILVALYPNATHILQPLDVAVLKQKWKSIVRQWRIDHDGHEISKLHVPAALNGFISDPDMVNNIKSGFRCTGLYTFNPNNVNYSKIVLRNAPTVVQDISTHLAFIESHIDKELLKKFYTTKETAGNWKYDTESVPI